MKKVKSGISFLISFIMMLLLLVAMGMLFFMYGIGNEKLYFEVVKDNKTVDDIYEGVNDKLKYVMLSNNIPESVVNNIITKDEVEDSVFTTVSNVLDYIEGNNNSIKKFDSSIYSERLIEAIKSQLTENGVALTPEVLEVLDEIKESANDIIDSEVENIDVSKISSSSYSTKIQKIVAIMTNKTYFLSIIGVYIVLAIALMIMWRKSITRAFSWIGYSSLSSGVLVLVVGLSGYISKFYNNIALTSETLKENISSIIQRYFITLSTIGGIFAIVGIFFVLLYWIHLVKKNNR